MTPQDRVLAACAFQKPDKIPRFENFWEYPESWEQALGEKAGLTDAGIDGLHPLERRANMNIAAIRKRYPDLILAGGMCNTRTLINGSPSDIESETREIIELGRDGGVIIGSHSLSPEIPLENFRIYHETCLKYGTF